MAPQAPEKYAPMHAMAPQAPEKICGFVCKGAAGAEKILETAPQVPKNAKMGCNNRVLYLTWGGSKLASAGGGPRPRWFWGCPYRLLLFSAEKWCVLIDYYFFRRGKSRLGLGLVKKHPGISFHRGAAGPEISIMAPQAPQK